MAGTPHIIKDNRTQIQLCDYWPPRSVFIIGKIGGVRWHLNFAQSPHANHLMPCVVTGTAEFPRIYHITDQLPFLRYQRVAGTRVDLHFTKILRGSSSEIGGQNLPPDRIVSTRDKAAAV